MSHILSDSHCISQVSALHMTGTNTCLLKYGLEIALTEIV